jgi:hypothetical protein
MPSDPTKPLLRLTPHPAQDRPVGESRYVPRPSSFPLDRQTRLFAPKFNRLAEILNRDPTCLELRADPSALAPERLLVFEVRGPIGDFARAIGKVPGLELVDEEELEPDGEDKSPVAYLMVPDVRALSNLESLWRRWLRGALARGETPWRDVFELLRDLRPWGPQDRLRTDEVDILKEEIADQNDDELVRLEIELVFRPNAAVATERETEIRTSIIAQGGRVVSVCRIDDIAYHAILTDLPVDAVRRIIDRATDGIAGLESVMYVRQQSIASSVELTDAEDSDAEPSAMALGEPILALLDGVPFAAHKLLQTHLIVDDQFGLEPNTQVAERMHGTAMASLIIHGDLNRPGEPLARRLHVIPVLGAADAFPSDRLIVDIIYSAVIAMREGTVATAPHVLIINILLGNPRRPFFGQVSPWARLLDRLAYRFGILFIVSAGNCTDTFPIEVFANHIAFEDAAPAVRPEFAVTRHTCP